MEADKDKVPSEARKFAEDLMTFGAATLRIDETGHAVHIPIDDFNVRISAPKRIPNPAAAKGRRMAGAARDAYHEGAGKKDC